MRPFTLLFLAAFGGGVLLQLWLLARHRRHVLAHAGEVPRAFAEKISPEEHRKAAAYTVARAGIGRIDLLLSAVILLAWTLGGGIQALFDLVERANAGPLWSGIILVLLLLLVTSLLELPLSLWRVFILEQRFGFNRMSVRRFFLDLLLQWLLLLILGVPLLAAILLLMDGAGDLWWLAGWALLMLFMLAVTWIYPTLIAPLFNRFSPLPEGSLKQRILALLQRCGFASKGIFVMDGSRRSGHSNAYFTGLGRNKRIVFFDTLMESLAEEEMEAVLAHELGHFKRRHVLKNLLLSAGMSLAGFALLGWLADQPWFYLGLGVSRSSDALALILFILAVPVFTQFLQPLFALLSRRHEFEADAFATEMAGAEPMIRALVKLYRENANTLTPDPLYSAFHDSHPPAAVRIAHLQRGTAGGGGKPDSVNG